MKLIIEEILSNTLEIDEDFVMEYLQYCKENNIENNKYDLVNYLLNEYYTSDFIVDTSSDYIISDEDYNYFVTKFNND